MSKGSDRICCHEVPRGSVSLDMGSGGSNRVCCFEVSKGSGKKLIFRGV